MAQTLETLIVKLEADVSGLRRELNQAVDNAQRQTDRLDKSFTNVGNTIRNVFALGGTLYAAQGFIRGLGALASEAQRAENAVLVFNKQLQRSNIDIERANTVVQGLSDRFGVLPSVVQEATTLILRAGGSLEDVEKALTAAGASAAAAGTDITRAFENVSVAVATGRSELLETSGIVANLGPAQQRYAQSVGKTVEQLTEQELIQARVNAIFEESKSEIEDVDELLSGLSGSSARLNTALAELRVEFGENILPAVTELVGAFASLVDTLGDLGVWDALGSAIESTTGRLTDAITAVDGFFESLTNREEIVRNFRNLLIALNPFDVLQGQSEEEFFRQFGLTAPTAAPTVVGGGGGGGGRGGTTPAATGFGLADFPSFAGSPAAAAAAEAQAVVAAAGRASARALEQAVIDAERLRLRLALNLQVQTPEGLIDIGDVPDYVRQQLQAGFTPGVRVPGAGIAPALGLAGGGVTQIKAPALTDAINDLEGATRSSAEILAGRPGGVTAPGVTPFSLPAVGTAVTSIVDAGTALSVIGERRATLQERFDTFVAGLESSATVLFDDLPEAVRGVNTSANDLAVALAIAADTATALGVRALPIPTPTVTTPGAVGLPIPEVQITTPTLEDEFQFYAQTFGDNVLSAGAGFIDGIVASVQGGAIDQAFTILLTTFASAVGQTVSTAVVAQGIGGAFSGDVGDIIGALVAGLITLLGVSATRGGRRQDEVEEAAATARARTPSAIRIDFTFNQQNSLGLIDDPNTRARLREVGTDAYKQFEDVLRRNLLPRLDALEGRVFT